MTTDLITVAPNMDIVTAAKILLDNRINGAPVVNESGDLLGILCQSDLIAQQKKLPIPTVFTFLDSVIQLSSSKKSEIKNGILELSVIWMLNKKQYYNYNRELL